MAEEEAVANTIPQAVEVAVEAELLEPRVEAEGEEVVARLEPSAEAAVAARALAQALVPSQVPVGRQAPASVAARGPSPEPFPSRCTDACRL